MEFLAMNKINLPRNQLVSQSQVARSKSAISVSFYYHIHYWFRKNKEMFLEYFMYIINITSFAAPQDSTASEDAGIKPRARICKPFKEPRNRFPAWRNRYFMMNGPSRYTSWRMAHRSTSWRMAPSHKEPGRAHYVTGDNEADSFCGQSNNMLYSWVGWRLNGDFSTEGDVMRGSVESVGDRSCKGAAAREIII